MLFKAVLVGLMAWQLIEMIRIRRKQKQQEPQPAYIYATTDKPYANKEMERSAPPAYYARY